MVDHDRLFKELLTTFFVEFIELFLPEMVGYIDTSSLTFIDKELFTDVTAGKTHEADLVVKVKLRGSDSFFLIHTETQAQQQKAFGARIFRYFARLHERHGLPVYPVAVFSFEAPRTAQPQVYEIQFPDITVLRFEYRIIQLNRLNWRQFIKVNNPVASALMAKMHFFPNERAEVKLECLRMIATLKLDKARTRLLSGFVDTYLQLNELEMEQFSSRVHKLDESQQEDVMEIVTSWMQEGMAIGQLKGREEGRKEAALSLVARQLRRRVGPLDDDFSARLISLPVEKLELLAEDLLDFSSIDDFRQWLDEHLQEQD